MKGDPHAERPNLFTGAGVPWVGRDNSRLRRLLVDGARLCLNSARRLDFEWRVAATPAAPVKHHGDYSDSTDYTTATAVAT